MPTRHIRLSKSSDDGPTSSESGDEIEMTIDISGSGYGGNASQIIGRQVAQYQNQQQQQQQHQQQQQQQHQQPLFACSLNEHGGGSWECKPYKRQIIQREITNATGTGDGDYETVENKLEDLGVTVYEVVYDSKDLFDDIRDVVRRVSNESRKGSERDLQRCLLYRDEMGRLFNVTFRGEASALAATWKSNLEVFSGFQAMVALITLARAFACATADSETIGIKPGYISLVLGLILTEETSLSWVNVSMLVYGTPSMSAYSLQSCMTTDWPRKLTLLILAIAGGATSDPSTQKYLTIVGIAMACAIICSNLGSRAWFLMKKKPLRYDGMGAFFLAYVISILAGIAVPYLGYRQVKAGGQAALETIIQSALLVAFIFILTDFDDVQRFFIVGSQNCNQDIVNISIGIWWSLSFLMSMFFCRRIKKYQTTIEEEEEVIVIEDQDSPVGYKVPSIPDFRLDKSLNVQPYFCCNMKFEIILGIILAFGVGGVIVYMGFTDKDDKITSLSFSDLFDYGTNIFENVGNP